MFVSYNVVIIVIVILSLRKNKLEIQAISNIYYLYILIELETYRKLLMTR